MRGRINGVQISADNASTIYYTFPQMIERASQSVRLRPGDIFGSGTCGTGCILELGTEVHRWLEPGDVVEMEIERLGVLRNTLVGERPEDVVMPMPTPPQPGEEPTERVRAVSLPPAPADHLVSGGARSAAARGVWLAAADAGGQLAGGDLRARHRLRRMVGTQLRRRRTRWSVTATPSSPPPIHRGWRCARALRAFWSAPRRCWRPWTRRDWRRAAGIPPGTA